MRRQEQQQLVLGLLKEVVVIGLETSFARVEGPVLLPAVVVEDWAEV